MPYAERNDLGEVISLQQFPKSQDNEYLEPSHPDIVAFVNRRVQTQDFSGQEENTDLVQALSHPNRTIAKASEDLIALMIEKQIVVFNKLPEAIQNKLLEREKLRCLIAFGANGYIYEEQQTST